MTETHPRPPQAAAAHGRRRRRTIQRIIASIYLALALAAAVFALITWRLGRLNPINVLVFALVIAGTAPVGLLVWGGDDLASRHMDEGQREMNLAAQSDAFQVGYFGLYVLFFGLTFIPALRDAMPIAVGALLLVVNLTWMGGYMWRRWRP
jgi:hypothetical protein